MSHFFGLVIFVALASIAFAQKEYPAINLRIANSIPDYLDQYPNSSAIKLTAGVSSSNRYFTFGTLLTGDVQLAEATNSLKFQSLQDATIELKYPSPQNTAVISRLDVYVSLDSKPVNCYVTSFGARNSSISVWVQSKATNKFEYTVRFFGRKAIEYPSTDIQIAAKIDDYLTLHPSANVTRFSEDKYDNGTIRYSVGNRVGADHLVSTAVASYSFPIVQDVALTLEYPQINGTGAYITYMEFLLTDSKGENATGFVVSGGHEQDYIKVWIHAKNSTIFNYVAEIYGYFLK